MAKFRKIISVFMVCVMGVLCASSCAPDSKESSKSSETSSSQKLQLFQTDVLPTKDQMLSRIKAEYLIENQGYSDDDEIVVILSLYEDALIDSYLGDGELSEKVSLAEYAASPAGAQKGNALTYAQTDLIRALTAQKLITSVNYTYKTIANAIAVTTTYGNLKAIEEMSGVKQAIIAETYNHPQESSTLDASAIVNNVDVYETGIFNSGSVADKGITGKGTSVAVLDSGFDLSHAVFNTYEPEGPLMFDRTAIETALPNMNASQTTRGLEVSDVWYSNKIPFSYDYGDKDWDVFPYDSEHGTHVAGIIGGKADSYVDENGNIAKDENGNVLPFLGVAVDTQLVLMKVFPDLSAGAETDDILAAVEDAVLLGVDCINMSLGSACGFAREADGDIINDVYDKVNESGVSLITAGSNNYSSGFGGAQGNTPFVTNPDSGTVGSPSTYAPALSVASISGTKSKYLVGNGSQVVFFNESNSISAQENDFFGELYAAMGWSTTDGATHTLEYVTVPGVGLRANYTGIDVKGKIALVRRGDNTFEEKAAEAKSAGAIACIIYNNVEGDILMSMGKTDHIPTISISKDDGTILAQHEEGTLVLGYSQQAGPFMSDFSSWGPLPDLTLKPEITAHGGNITSSVPGGGFDQISGTSMACPNLCGIVVLIRQFLKTQNRYENYTWKEISVLTNQMLMSTATIILDEQGNPYSPRKQGAGLASLYNVVNTKAYLTVEGQDRTKLELLDDPDRTGVYEMVFDVVNVSSSSVQYKLDVVGMTESVSTSDSQHVAEKDQILSSGFKAEVVSGGGTLSDGVVTVRANETAKIRVTYTLSAEDKDLIDNSFPYGMYVEGFVKLVASGEGEVDLNIPFLAFYGDWTQAPIFDKTYFEVETEAHDDAIDPEDKLQAEYLATTPYGSYYYNYIVPLGTYLYDIDTTMYDYIPATEEHIAISNRVGTIDGLNTVYAGLLRNCKTMIYTITDKVTGEVVWTHEVDNARKAYSQGGTPIPNYEFLRMNSAQIGLVNNKQYTFTMKGLLDYDRDGADTNVRNTFSFDFTLDDEAPIIKDATYETVYDRTLKKNRYYITLTVYDNHYVQSIAPITFTSNSSYTYLTKNPIPVYGERGQDTTVRFEITDYLEDLEYDALSKSALAFFIEDYALNPNMYICSLPGTRGDFKFTRDGTYDGATYNILTISQNEIVDLTQYLATSDDSLDAGKDYLKYLTWTSSNERIAVVNEGQVLGLRAGNVSITVTENIYAGRSATIMVNVRSSAAATSVQAEENDYGISLLSQNDLADVNGASLESLRFSYFDTLFAHARAGQSPQIGNTGDRIYLSAIGSSLSLYPGEQIQLHYDLDPWYVEDKYELTFESSNPNVAYIDPQTGVMAAMSKGSATITLRASGSNIQARLRVTVLSEFVIDDARTLIAYKGLGGDVVIPDDEGILYIGPFAFSLYETNYNYGEELPDDDLYANRIPGVNSTITSVVIPDGVTEIQQSAFYNCTGLKSVTLPDTCKFLRQYAFYGATSLEEINLEHVEVIAEYAFTGCESLNNIDLSKTYTIGLRAFDGCVALAYVDLTALRNTGREAFRGTTALKEVEFDKNGRTKLSYGMFVQSGLEKVELYESKTIPEYAFAQCENLTEVIIHNSLVSVGTGAFCQNPKLKSVTFEGSVDALGAQIFYDCSALTEITLPNSSFTLGEAAFYDCTALEVVKFGANTRITEAIATMFRGTALSRFEVDGANTHYSVSADGKFLLEDGGSTIALAAVKGLAENLTLGGEYKRIASGAFSGTEIVTLTIESATFTIGAYAFAGCANLEKVTLPNAADANITIGNRAFINCEKLAEVENLDKVATVGDYAFAITDNSLKGSLKSVVIGANAHYGEAVFFNTALVTVTIGENTSFGSYAFQRCTALRTVNMPAEGGVHFGFGCFALDTSLAEIDLSKTNGIIEDETFYGCTALTTANLTNVTKIGAYAFADCASLLTVNIPVVEVIGEGAFSENNGSAPIIESITLPSTLEELGAGVFFGCHYLKSVEIPTGIESIGAYTFANCISLVSVSLPGSVESIGDYAFAGCSVLTNVNLGQVKNFGEGAFVSAGHTVQGGSLPDLYLLGNVDLTAAVEVGYGAFADTGVTGNVNAPALVSIGPAAFQGSAISSFNAPALETIGIAAFENNTALREFALYGSIKEIGERAFYGCASLENFLAGDSTDGIVNDYVQIKDGVLYTVLPNGKLQLTSVPGGKNFGRLEVVEGTTRIDDYAGSANTHVNYLLLPDSLVSIGSYAFYGYTTLKTVEFRSVTAPQLESDPYMDDSYYLQETDPGYDIIHNQLDMFGWELNYTNFIDLVGRRTPIAMVLPSNSDIAGYDSIVYLVYFGSVANATRSDYVAMEQTMKDFIDYASRIQKIKTITMADEKLISNAVIAMNAIKQDPTAYGYTAEEWNELITVVTQARNTIARLRIANATKAVRDIQARIDALPDIYDGSAEHDALIESLRAAIEGLSVDNRNILILDRYNSFLAQYNAAHENQDKPNPGGGGLSTGALIGISIAAAVVVAGIAVPVALLLKRKKHSKD